MASFFDKVAKQAKATVKAAPKKESSSPAGTKKVEQGGKTYVQKDGLAAPASKQSQANVSKRLSNNWTLPAKALNSQERAQRTYEGLQNRGTASYITPENTKKNQQRWKALQEEPKKAKAAEEAKKAKQEQDRKDSDAMMPAALAKLDDLFLEKRKNDTSVAEEMSLEKFNSLSREDQEALQRQTMIFNATEEDKANGDSEGTNTKGVLDSFGLDSSDISGWKDGTLFLNPSEFDNAASAKLETELKKANKNDHMYSGYGAMRAAMVADKQDKEGFNGVLGSSPGEDKSPGIKTAQEFMHKAWLPPVVSQVQALLDKNNKKKSDSVAQAASEEEARLEKSKYGSYSKNVQNLHDRKVNIYRSASSKIESLRAGSVAQTLTEDQDIAINQALAAITTGRDDGSAWSPEEIYQGIADMGLDSNLFDKVLEEVSAGAYDVRIATDGLPIDPKSLVPYIRRGGS